MPEEQRTRLLFVDDEPSIRVTLPMVLERSGFSVTVAESVKQALQAIATQTFDVLLTDLNIGQPGDGFTVVSAMRRTQPEVATVILTGYPAFETALAAIRSQVDDYLVKPAHPDELVERLREKLKSRRPRQHVSSKRLPELIQEQRDEIIDRWIQEVHADPQLDVIGLDDNSRIDHFRVLLDEVVRAASEDGGMSPGIQEAAEKHGLVRRQQGYTVQLMLRENRLLRTTISRFTQQNLIAIEISYIIPDMVLVDETLSSALEYSMAAFLSADAVRH